MSVKTSSLGARVDSPSERGEGERATPKRLEEWAAALAQSVSAQIPPNWRPLSAPPEGWRTGDKPLTPSAGEAAQPGVSESATAALAESGDAEQPGEGGDGARLSLTVDAGDLGELSLVVDRTSAGVRVIIGVADAGAIAAVGPERAALERALTAAGLSIDSVKVVPQASAGILLAPTPKARMARTNEPRENADEASSNRKRTQRKLSLIG
jgi:hypothetical protein